MKEFVVGANDTGIKVFNILEQASVLTIHNAHQDNIKCVKYLRDDLILSASSDRTLKLWDLRNSAQALSSLKLPHGLEDLCLLPGGEEAVIANGPLLSLVKASSSLLEKVADYQAFQRPVMRVRWDSTR